MLKIILNLVLPAIFTAFISNLYAQATWMTDNAALLSNKQLNEIALPGAHDAGTFTINVSRGNGIHRGDAQAAAATDANSLKRMLANSPTFALWRKPRRTTAEMLADGIRYFNLRVGVDGKGALMTCHGLYGASIASILDDVKAFTDKNPREVVLLGFNGFWDRQFGEIERNKGPGEIEGLRREKWAELLDLLKTKLGGKLASGKKFSPKSKLSELWRLKTNNQVDRAFQFRRRSRRRMDLEGAWKKILGWKVWISANLKAGRSRSWKKRNISDTPIIYPLRPPSRPTTAEN